MATDNKKAKRVVAFEKAFERNRYFYGKLLSVDDFQTEQEYFIRKNLLLNRELEGSGIISGLDVSNLRGLEDGFTMDITAGYALDRCGNLIVMEHSRAYTIFGSNFTKDRLYLYIEYQEHGKDRVESLSSSDSCESNCCDNRILEGFELGIYTDKVAHQGVLISTFSKGDNGYTASGQECKFVLSNQKLDRRIKEHESDIKNPHGVSAQQVGAIKSLNLIQNGGGNIQLVSEDNSIEITPKSETHMINLELSQTVLAELRSEMESLKSNLSMVLRFLMNRVFSYKLSAFSSVLEHFESDRAIEIVKSVQEAINDRLYLNEEKFLNLMKHLSRLESELIEEIRSDALKRELEFYEIAVKELQAVIADSDLFAIVVAQDEVCARAEKLVPMVEKVSVPELISLHINKARGRLAKVGLLIGKERYTVSTDPQNTILTQSPNAETEVNKGTYVDVEIAIPPERVKVPDLLKLDFYSAMNKIKDSRLIVGAVVERESLDFETGTVMEQKPLPDIEVDPNSIVDLVIAKAQEMAVVPKLIGLEEKKAEDILMESQLVLGEVKSRTSPQPAGTVISQLPLMGTKIPIDNEVSIVLAIPPKMTTVPDFVGENFYKDREKIEDLLKGRGLQLGNIKYDYANKRDGEITGQEPKADSRVVVGTAIDLMVSKSLIIIDPRDPIYDPRLPIDVLPDPVIVDPRKPKTTTPIPVREIDGIGSVYEGRLGDRGITTVDSLATSDAKDVAEILKTSEPTARRIIADARTLRSRG